MLLCLRVFIHTNFITTIASLRPVLYISLNLLIVSSNLYDKKNEQQQPVACVYMFFPVQNTHYSCTFFYRLNIWKISANLLGLNTLVNHFTESVWSIHNEWKSSTYESPDHSKHTNKKKLNEKRINFAIALNGITMTVWISHINRLCHLFCFSPHPSTAPSILPHSQSNYCALSYDMVFIWFHHLTDMWCEHTDRNVSMCLRAHNFLSILEFLYHHQCKHYHRFYIGFCKESQEQWMKSCVESCVENICHAPLAKMRFICVCVCLCKKTPSIFGSGSSLFLPLLDFYFELQCAHFYSLYSTAVDLNMSLCARLAVFI